MENHDGQLQLSRLRSHTTMSSDRAVGSMPANADPDPGHRTSAVRTHRGAPDDLVKVVSALAQDLELLDSMIRNQRSLLQRDGPGTLSGEEANLQWTQIRASADVVVNRAQGVLEVVKQQTSD